MKKKISLVRFFNDLAAKWSLLVADKKYRISFVIGMGMLILSYFMNFWASVFNDAQTYISVGDLILDHIPTYNMEFFFTWGMYGIMVVIFVYPLFFKPEIAPFAMKTYALLIFLRCAFIMLTNIGPPEGFFYAADRVGGNLISDLMFRNDLFFSGHTAYPFMAYLIYRKSLIRWFFLAGSALMAVTVLMMHVHYSIDVFAAFFITFGVYSMSDSVFNKLNLRFRSKIKLLTLKLWRK
jgi:hypothetical protein